jgi:hypothetical protein
MATQKAIEGMDILSSGNFNKAASFNQLERETSQSITESVIHDSDTHNDNNENENTPYADAPSYDDGSTDHDHDLSSIDGTSVLGGTSKSTTNIFKKDGGVLCGARCCFLLTVLCAACALATVVAIVATRDEQYEFQTQVCERLCSS